MSILKESARQKFHEVIFEADTFWGKFFDVVLIISIIASVLVVMLESVSELNAIYGKYFKTIEWVFTIVFTVEYIARIISLRKPLNYVKSFYGVIDLLSILPTFLSLLFVGAHALIVMRVMRLLRIFRVLKLVRFFSEATRLFSALQSSLPKITVFLLSVICILLIVGTAMYIIEGRENGFTSIPKSIYWAIVTMTTVGYGDIAPSTVLGQTLASLIMILGYGIIAVPTGIVTSEINLNKHKEITTQACPVCSMEGHDADAAFCKYCGGKL
ncbi:MAG: ion transporter [Cyclobacteriaceae bacterium]|nr:ion transporter [Cyclobacteriaceae bacterium]